MTDNAKTITITGDSPSSDDIIIVAAGDLRSLHGGNPYDSKVKELLNAKDISTVNLETPLSSRGQPIPKCGPNLISPENSVEVISNGGFDIASLANNHIMDYGRQALNDTIDICNQNNIATVGAGLDVESAGKIEYRKIDQTSFAFVAIGDSELTINEDDPGIASSHYSESLHLVRQAAKKADVVIVNMHVGNEYALVPSPRVRNLARSIIDNGASAIIGHHPHRVQGVEIYNNAPIIFSTGNFLFDMPNKQRKCWYYGLIVKLSISGKDIKTVELYPCKHATGKESKVSLLEGDENKLFLDHIDFLSKIVNDSKLAEEYWKYFCWSKRESFPRNLRYYMSGFGNYSWSSMKNAIKQLHFARVISLAAESLDLLLEKKSTKQQRLLRTSHMLGHPSNYEVLETLIKMELSGFIPDQNRMTEFNRLSNGY